jgi:O-antigen ligase
MLLALAILVARRLRWSRWLAANAWLIAFFAFCAVSVVWSDFPAIAFKRWIRAVGSVMMILVVLSERDPLAALATLVRRCAYILLPLSIVLIKYFREFAVVYNGWTGQEYLVGATTDKNALGRLCMIAGLFILWELSAGKSRMRFSIHWWIAVGMLAIAAWLLLASGSATSLFAFLLGALSLVVLRSAFLRRRARHLGSIFVFACFAAVIVALTTNLIEVVVHALGRNVTLTDRTYIWRDLLAMGTHPLVGVGYDSFWLGKRLDTFMERHHVNAAHNGFLEIYIELGMAGLVLFGCFLVNAFVNAKRSLLEDADYGVLRLTMLITFVAYNMTETGYKATTLICFVLLLVAVQVPAPFRRSGALISGQQPASERQRLAWHASGRAARLPGVQHRRS